MRTLRATLAAAALVAVALIAPAAASAAPSAAPVHTIEQTRAATLGYSWDG